MGVPAFYRWLTEKYPKVVQDILEERVPEHGEVDITAPNPSGLECDNLYIDMNGIIHPCSHPEVGKQPDTEEEMYNNVCLYVDRLMRVIRPRKMLFLAIDGVAPRAKMNQQRSRRFRSAQEARELKEIEAVVRTELDVTPTKEPWDSNVITPGTTFMVRLAEYLRFYIRKRLSEDAAWRNLRVLFSDASIPGEGEHKIMSHIRLQRAQPGYLPNTVHVLHGLDADLIMLGLATHEAHFYISREEVLFGRKSREDQETRQRESGFTDAQRALNEAVGPVAMQNTVNQQKPLQRLSIPILREYIAFEFENTLLNLPFPANLERLIDDIVFLCFFVGNDFLPHLPSLDIRVGALDFLFNVYKKVLPTLGDYITSSGGNVNLSKVEVIVREVAAIEDHVFMMKHDNEQRERNRRESMQRQKTQRPEQPPPIRQGRAARILAGNDAAKPLNHRKTKTIQVSHIKDNVAAAEALRKSLSGSKRKTAPESTSEDAVMSNAADSSLTTHTKNNGSAEETPTNPPSSSKLKDPSEVGDMEEEFDVDDDDDDEEDAKDPDIPKVEDIIKVQDPEVAKRFKEKVKAIQQKKLDEYAQNVEDKVRLHEKGWKDRYYTDKCKADDVRNHGGREHLFRSYVMGLCWVMKYYYDGCPSWKWYYPFHYAPFASDLQNIDRFSGDCRSFDLSTPFNPVEQLMAVLPSDSVHAVPKAARWLMTNPESPIIDFYPIDVPVDPNGKAMPWLWVVLLPFIDEERLLAAFSPTMAKWTKDELFCNTRGLDDGYLYVHRSNQLTKKLALVLKDGCSAKDTKTRLTDAAVYGCPGFSGRIRPPLSNELRMIDDMSPVHLPQSADSVEASDNVFDHEIQVNQAICVSFTEPPKLSHKSILLPGAEVPPPALKAMDKTIRRPKLSRGGGTIANLGTSNGQSHQPGYGSMNISSYERNMAQQNGRGHEMYQTGNRTWGSFEPTPKRRNFPPQPHGPNQWQINNANQAYHQPYQQQGNRQYSNSPYNQQQRGQAPPPPRNQPHNRQTPQRNQPHPQAPQGNQPQQYSHRGGDSRGGHGAPRGPPPQHAGYDFRSYNQGQRPNYNSGRPSQNQDQRSRASADIMNSLRAQLSSTLHRNRNPHGRDNRR